MAFYSPRHDGFDRTSIETAQVFAAPLTVALRAVDRTESLQRAVASRDVIGQAKGMLMERHGLSPEEAFSRLVRCSQETNIRLVEVATWFVHEGSTRGEGSAEGPDASRSPSPRPIPGGLSPASPSWGAPALKGPGDRCDPDRSGCQPTER